MLIPCRLYRNLLAAPAILALSIGIARAQADMPPPSQSASESFESAKYGFALSYPDSFESLPAQGPQVPLALRDRRAGFPTFNVIVEPAANFVPSLSLEQRAERIRDDYRKVGLNDATLTGHGIVEAGGLPGFRFDIEYSSSGSTLKSLITQIPGERHLYTMTYIDAPERLSGSAMNLEAILQSFRTDDRPFGGKSRVEPEGRGYFFLAALGGVLILFIALALRMRRRMMPN